MFDTTIILVVFIGLSSIGWLLHRGQTAGQVLPDMSGLGVQSRQKLKGTAVVCGGRYASSLRLSCLTRTHVYYSISGILSARVCASHFENVVLVDPEFTRALEGGRKGRIMQYYSSHGAFSLLVVSHELNSSQAFHNPFTKGLRLLWPNIDERVKAAGGLYANPLIIYPKG
jgi:hypothetical protein